MSAVTKSARPAQRAVAEQRAAAEQHAVAEQRDSKLRQVIFQLLTSLESHDNELGDNFQRVYLHLYRSVTEVQLSGHGGDLLDVIQVLEIERETWQTLALRFAAESAQQHGQPRAPSNGNTTPGVASPASSTLSLEV